MRSCSLLVWFHLLICVEGQQYLLSAGATTNAQGAKGIPRVSPLRGKEFAWPDRVSAVAWHTNLFFDRMSGTSLTLWEGEVGMRASFAFLTVRDSDVRTKPGRCDYDFSC